MIRTLRQDSRSWQSGFIRAALLTMMLATLMLSRAMTLGATGLGFVWWILWCSYAAVTLVSACWFGASIPEEREQRSLGLLRMTNLNSLAVLLGKWCPRLLLVVVLVSLQFPLALLGITLGGVTAKQVVAAYVALLAYTFMISSIGMLASAISYTTERAVGLVAIAWMALSLSPWFASMCTSRLLTYQWIDETFADRLFLAFDGVKEFSLWHRMNSILSTRSDDRLWACQVWGNVVAGVIAFIAAWVVFEYFAIYRLDVPLKAVPRERLINRLFRPKASASNNRNGSRVLVGRAWRIAVAWRDFHFHAGGWWAVIVKAVIYACVPFVVAGVAKLAGAPFPDLRRVFGVTYMVVGGFAFIGESLFYSNRVFGTDAYEKNLTSIMLLPMSTRQIAWSKVGGFLVALIPSVVVFVVGCLSSWDSADEFFGRVLSYQGLLAASSLLLFLHASAFFSIHTRGGLLVAFVLLYGVAILIALLGQFVIPGGWGSEEFDTCAIAFVMWMAMAVFQILTARSLRNKAAG